MFTVYAIGPVSASVCTDLSNEEATAEMNRLHPTGVSSSWQISEDEFFRGGEVRNGGPCNTHPDERRHILFIC